MPNKNKAKGTRVEREIRDQFRDAGWHAERVWGSGSAKAVHEALADDLKVMKAGAYLSIEVKARRNGAGWRVLEGWLGSADALVLKQARREPLVLLPLARFLELMKGETP